jgi:hypothetical protein
MHGGWQAEIKQVRNYQLEKYKHRLNKFAGNDYLKTLTDEISILRLLLETKLNNTKDDADLIMQSDSISDMTVKIKSLVESCTKLDIQNNQMLDVGKVKVLAVSILDIISKYLTPEQLEICSDEIRALFESDTQIPEQKATSPMIAESNANEICNDDEENEDEQL